MSCSFVGLIQNALWCGVNLDQAIKHALLEVTRVNL